MPHRKICANQYKANKKKWVYSLSRVEKIQFAPGRQWKLTAMHLTAVLVGIFAAVLSQVYALPVKVSTNMSLFYII